METPSILNKTIYRAPTDKLLKLFNNFPKLTPKLIANGFYYTMVGRGILGKLNAVLIVNGLRALIDMYSGDKRYKLALDIALKFKARNGSSVWVLIGGGNSKLIKEDNDMKKTNKDTSRGIIRKIIKLLMGGITPLIPITRPGTVRLTLNQPDSKRISRGILVFNLVLLFMRKRIRLLKLNDMLVSLLHSELQI